MKSEKQNKESNNINSKIIQKNTTISSDKNKNIQSEPKNGINITKSEPKSQSFIKNLSSIKNISSPNNQKGISQPLFQESESKIKFSNDSFGLFQNDDEKEVKLNESEKDNSSTINIAGKKEKNNETDNIHPNLTALDNNKTNQVKRESLNLINVTIESENLKDLFDKKKMKEDNISFSNANIDGIIDEKKIITIREKINACLISKNNQNNITLESLIDDIKELIKECPVINKFVESKFLFEESDFDIFDQIEDMKVDEKKNEDEEEKESKKLFVFIVNLANLISIINLIWEFSKANIEYFKKYMSKLNLYFGLVKTESNETDFVLLAPMPSNLYYNISCYWKDLFKNHRFFGLALAYSEKSNKFTFDNGYYYEEINNINILDKIGELNCTVHPNILYYIKKKAAEKLIKLKIVKTTNIIFHDLTKDKKKYKGFNELDNIITMKKDITFTTNENFKCIKNGLDNPEVELEKGVTYFFEIKTNPNDLKAKLKDIRKVFNRFIEAMKNVEQLDNIKLLSKSELIFICNKSCEEAINLIKDNKITENTFYSNPLIGFGAFIKLNKKINFINEQLEKTKKNQNQEIQNIVKLNEKLNAQLEKTKINQNQEIQKIVEEKLNEKLYENNLFYLMIF